MGPTKQDKQYLGKLCKYVARGSSVVLKGNSTQTKN